MHKDQCSEFSDKLVVLPKTTDFSEPILTVAALQLIAYETAKLRGCDIDKPRNLAKSVTVEESQKYNLRHIGNYMSFFMVTLSRFYVDFYSI